MARQHATPILLSDTGALPLTPLSLAGGADSVSELAIQQLIHEHPGCLPIAEIDPMFCNPVPICTELNTTAGPIDNFMVTPSGLPVLAECKLWRNPEGRREVVGQILDYAKELTRWTSSDLQREVARRLKSQDRSLLEIVQSAGHAVDEVAFNDALTFNLRRGRFLLLIVGDGIREGVEAIAEYVQAHAGLHFTLGLVELPIFELPDGRRVVMPRVVARTKELVRTVIAVPDGHLVQDDDSADEHVDRETNALAVERQEFWREFLSGLTLDDPEQPLPRAPKMGYITFMLPASSGSSWLTVYRDVAAQEVGVFLSSARGYDGEVAANAIAEDWHSVRDELGGTVRLVDHKGRSRIIDSFKVEGAFGRADVRERAFEWLRRRTNDFVNVMRPRVRAVVADLQERS